MAPPGASGPLSLWGPLLGLLFAHVLHSLPGAAAAVLPRVDHKYSQWSLNETDRFLGLHHSCCDSSALLDRQLLTICH